MPHHVRWLWPSEDHYAVAVQGSPVVFSVLFKYFHFTCTRFGRPFLVRALYVRIFQLGFCVAQRAYSCTLKKGYARNVCAFTNYDTLTCLTRVLAFSYYHWCHASTELCLFFCYQLIYLLWPNMVNERSTANWAEIFSLRATRREKRTNYLVANLN